MKIIIAGSRDITDRDAVEVLIRRAIRAGATEIVHGGCRGVDSLAHKAVDGLLPIKVFPANWNKFGNGAGPIRNRAMAEYADAILALQFPIKRRKKKRTGTDDMIECMDALDKPVAEYILSENQGPVCVRDWSES